MNDHVQPLDVESLCAAVEAGFEPKYVFFWGHTAKSGVLGNECFSQWYDSPFVVDGEHYPTAEHFMMAGKARLFGDDATAARIMTSKYPAQVKKLGREVADFDEGKWREHRFAIVTAGSHAKFSQNPTLKSYLLGTNSRVLVEASPMDKVWGIGLGVGDSRTLDPRKWNGLNLLGFALMHARAAIAAGR